MPIHADNARYRLSSFLDSKCAACSCDVCAHLRHMLRRCGRHACIAIMTHVLVELRTRIHLQIPKWLMLPVFQMQVECDLHLSLELSERNDCLAAQGVRWRAGVSAAGAA